MTRVSVRSVVGTGLALGLVLVAGCRTSHDAAPVPSTVGPQSTLAESNGYSCTDPTGDIGSQVQGVGTLSEPAGIDLVTAEAHVDGLNLNVKYTTVGPIESAPKPFFVMFQGDASAPTVSFDLRTEPTGANGAWALSVGTTPASGGVERFQPLPTGVVVDGNTLRYSVPLTSIPPIATLQWSFGSTSTQANDSVLFDDCSSIPSLTEATAPSIVTVPPN